MFFLFYSIYRTSVFLVCVSLNVLKELYMYFTVKYVNILKYKNSVNITVTAKNEDYFQTQNTIK